MAGCAGEREGEECFRQGLLTMQSQRRGEYSEGVRGLPPADHLTCSTEEGVLLPPWAA